MSQIFLKHLKVENFKSFKNLDLTFKQFNVVIGANASGKSNFVQIFNFLKDIREHGLDSACPCKVELNIQEILKMEQEQI